jgi:hemerythrin
MWLESYSLGVKNLDDDHKRLFQMQENLKNTECKSIEKEEFRKVLHEIRFYLKEHFMAEEKFMRNAHYKDFSSHKDKHESIVLAFGEIIRSTKKMDIICIKVKKFVNKIIIEHIIHEDVKLNQLLNNMQEEPVDGISDIGHV